MNVETEITKMTSVFLFLSLFFLIVHYGVEAAFLGDKPMIYINLFDEIVVDNASSKFIDKEISSASTPTSFNSLNDVRKKLDSSKDLLKGNGENKTSASAPFDSVFEFDKPSKADSTETNANESVMDSSTGARLADVMDPEMLEPELNRIFFLKAITSLIAHIMEALFSIDETSKLNESPSFDYYSAPSRKLKKRDLPTEGIKPSDVVSTPENIPSVDLDIISNADLLRGDFTGLKDPASTSTKRPELLIMYDEFLKNMTDENSQTPSPTLGTSHISPHHRVRKSKTHSSTEWHDVKSIADENSQHEAEVHQEGKVSEQKKHTPQTDLPKEPVLEEITKMIHFNEEKKTVLNDDVVNKKDAHVFGGDHKYAADDRDGYKFDEHEHMVDDEEDDYVSDLQESNSLITILLVSTTILIFMIFVAFGVGMAYIVWKNQTQSGNRNASSVHAAVA